MPRTRAARIVDSDSDDDLFITQNVVSEAVRSAKRLRFSRKSASKSFVLQDDTESDASSSSSSQQEGGYDEAERKRRKLLPLPKYSFPFLVGRKYKPRSSLLPVRQNRSLHNFLMGGFFECVSKSLHTIQLPTVDTEEEEILPLTEDEEEEVDEDIEVVDRKCFAVLSKVKCPQVEKAKRKEQQGGRSPTLPLTASAKPSISRVLPVAECSEGGAAVDIGRSSRVLRSHGITNSQMKKPEINARGEMREEKKKQDTDASPSITCEPIALYDSTISDVCHTDGPSPRRQSTGEPSDFSSSHPHLICNANSDATHSKRRSEEKRKHGADQDGGKQSPYSQEEGQQVATCKEVEIREAEEIPPSGPVRTDATEKKRRGGAEREQGLESPSSQEESQQGAMCEEVGMTEDEEIPPSGHVRAEATEKKRRWGAEQEREPESPSSQEEGQQGAMCEEVGITEVEEFPPSSPVRAEATEKKSRHGAEQEREPESPSSQEEGQQGAMFEEVGMTEDEEILPSGIVRAETTEKKSRRDAEQEREPESPSSQEEGQQGAMFEEVGITEDEEIPPSGHVSMEATEKKRRQGAEQEREPEPPSSQEESQQDAIFEEVGMIEDEEILPSGHVRAEATEKKSRRDAEQEREPELPSSQEEGRQGAMFEEVGITEDEEIPPSGHVSMEATEKKRRQGAEQEQEPESPSSQEESQQGAMFEEVGITEDEEIPPSVHVRAEATEKKSRQGAEQEQEPESPSNQEESQQGAMCEEVGITEDEEIPPSGHVSMEATEKKRRQGAEQEQEPESPSSQEESQQGAMFEEVGITEDEEIPPSVHVSMEATEKKRRQGAEQEQKPESPSSQEESQQGAMCEEVGMTEDEEIPPSGHVRAEATEKKRRWGAEQEREPESPSSQEEGQQGAMCEEDGIKEVEEIPPSDHVRAEATEKKRRRRAEREQELESPSSQEEGQQGAMFEEVGITEDEEIPPSGNVNAEPKSSHDNTRLQEDEGAEGSTTDRENAPSKPKKKKRKQSAVENRPGEGTDASGDCDVGTAEDSVMSETTDVASNNREEKKKKKKRMGLQHVEQVSSSSTVLQPQSDDLERKKRKKKRTCVNAESVDQSASESNVDPPHRSAGRPPEPGSSITDTQDTSDSSYVKRKKRNKKSHDENEVNGNPLKDEETDQILKSNEDEDVKLLPTKKKKKKRSGEETDSSISKESNTLSNASGKTGDKKTSEDEDVELLPKKRKKKKGREEETNAWISKTTGKLSNIAEKPADEKATEDEDVELLPKKRKRKKRREEETDSCISQESNTLSNTPSKAGDEKPTEDEDVELLPKKRKRKKRREEETDSCISQESNTLSNTHSKTGDEKPTEDEDVELLPSKKKKKKRREEETDACISNKSSTLSNTPSKTGDEKTNEEEYVELLPTKKKKKKRREEEIDACISKESNTLSSTPVKMGDDKTNEEEDVEQLPTKKKKKKRREEETDAPISKESNVLSNTPSKTGDEKTNEEEDVEQLPKKVKKKKRREDETDAWISKESKTLSNTASKKGDENTNEEEDVEKLPKKGKKKKRKEEETDAWISKESDTLSNTPGKTGDENTNEEEDVEQLPTKKKKKKRRVEETDARISEVNGTPSNIAGNPADEKATEDEDVELTTKKKKKKKQQRSREITGDSGTQSDESVSVLEKERSSSFPIADTEENGTLAQTQLESTECVRKKKKRKETMEKGHGGAFKEPGVTHRSGLPEAAEASRGKRRDERRPVTHVASAGEAQCLKTDEVVVLKKKKKKRLLPTTMDMFIEMAR